jgi:hypothetical protein
MQHHVDNEFFALTPEKRRRQIARILAAGVLRLHARAALPGDPGDASSPKNPAQSGQDYLEVLPETVLSVHTG